MDHGLLLQFNPRYLPVLLLDNESECMNMMDHLMSCFWEDLREFVEKEKMAKNKENKK